MINKICKECGGQVMSLTLTSIPPIHQKKCMDCNRVVSEQKEEVVTALI